MSLEDDEDRRAILARRRRFIALALAGLGGTAGACAGKREPTTAGPGDAEPARTAEAGAGDEPTSEDAEATSEPVRPKRRSRPQSCLRVHLPDEDAP